MQTEQRDPLAKAFEEAFQAIVDATPDPIKVPSLRTAPRVPQRRLRPTVLVATLLLAASTVFVVNSQIDTRGGSPPPSAVEPVGPSVASPDSSSVPPEVRAYWDRDGQLLSLAAEEPWLCPPAPSAGFSRGYAVSQVPSAITLDTSVGVVSRSASDYGPLCQQPPLATLTSSDNPSQSLIVYPSSAVGACTSLDVTCANGRGWADVAIGDSHGQVYVDSANTYVALRWTTPNGYPLHALGRDVSKDQAIEVAEALDIGGDGIELGSDVETLEFQLEDFGVRKGEWIDDIVNQVVVRSRGLSVQVSARFRPAFSVYQIPAGQLVGEDGNAVWVTDGGGILMVGRDNGVLVMVEGAADAGHALSLLNDVEVGLGNEG